MHPSARAHMALCIERYMEKERRYSVLDFGSRISPRAQQVTHRDLLAEYDCDYTGVDIRPGRNVDVVMKQPYRVPLKSASVDVILAGQVFEHVPFFWASLLELARVVRPNGYLFVTVPSRGHVHAIYDCWRYYPDGLRAMAAFSRLELRETYTDFPPAREGKRKHDYAAIDVENHYWGDTVGVFQKPARYPTLSIGLVRAAVLWWANRVPDLADAPPPADGRDEVLRVR